MTILETINFLIDLKCDLCKEYTGNTYFDGGKFILNQINAIDSAIDKLNYLLEIDGECHG
jgi:hypothetical protein